jgi:hypothetical protein
MQQKQHSEQVPKEGGYILERTWHGKLMPLVLFLVTVQSAEV